MSALSGLPVGLWVRTGSHGRGGIGDRKRESCHLQSWCSPRQLLTAVSPAGCVRIVTLSVVGTPVPWELRTTPPTTTTLASAVTQPPPSQALPNLVGSDWLAIARQQWGWASPGSRVHREAGRPRPGMRARD